MNIGILPSGHRKLPGTTGGIFAPGLLATQTADRLVEKGHDVTVYSALGSDTKAKVKSFDLISMNELYSEISISNPAKYKELDYQYELFLASQIIQDSSEYDIIHANDHRKIPYFSSFSKCPIVYTYHETASLNATDEIDRKRLSTFYTNNFFVAISHRQKEVSKKYFNFVGVVYNGVDTKKIKFNPDGGNNLIYTGRLIEVKAPHIALQIAVDLNKNIEVIGKRRHTKHDDKYFDAFVSPILSSPNIINKGFVPYPKIYKTYQNKKALIFPVQIEEPFGLVMIESMAAGTPVIAFARGSVPEIIKDGITGFIINPADDDIRGNWIIKKTGIEGMIEATKRLYSLPEEEYKKMRLSCRAHVEKNFTVEKMVDGYEKIYKEVIADWKKKNKK